MGLRKRLLFQFEDMKIRLTLKHIRTTILIICVVVLSFGLGYKAAGHGIKINFKDSGSLIKIERKIPEGKPADFSLFWTIWDTLDETFLDKQALDPKNMIYGAIKGLTASLGDPYTVFLPPKENEEAKEDLNGSFDGVGMQLGFKDEDKLAVVAPLKGTPAEKAGLRAGDFILRIVDEKKGVDRDTMGISLPEAVALIRGPKGTKVKLTLLHEGEKEPYVAEIVRETVIVASVELEIIDVSQKDKWLTLEGKNGKVAHLKLLKFGDRTSSEWDKAVGQIVDQGVNLKGVILDVRNNPGGYLSGSVFIASEFLKTGVVVKQEGSSGRVESFSVDPKEKKGMLLTIPLVVLVNEGSASASEIVAGALKYYERAKIVGQKTFGKGTIQEAQDLGEDGAGLHVTTARWLLPGGENIDKKGIEPDFKVELDPKDTEHDLQLEKAIEVLVL